MKENEILVEAIVNRNPTCQILVNTNLLNTDTALFQRLISLSNVTWMISFEDTEARYEYIRYPGEWNKFKTNLLHLADTIGPNRVHFNMVYCNLNYLSFWDTVDWAVSHGFTKNKMSISLYNNGVHRGPYDIRSDRKSTRLNSSHT